MNSAEWEISGIFEGNFGEFSTFFFCVCGWIRDLDLGFVAGEDLEKKKYLKGLENQGSDTKMM